MFYGILWICVGLSDFIFLFTEEFLATWKENIKKSDIIEDLDRGYLIK